MNPLLTTVISLLFLIAGGISFGIMMAKFGGRKFENPDRATRMHRILGWVFVALYLILLVVMINRLEQYWETTPPRIAIHVTLAITLFFLLAVKVTIPRYLPGLAKHLFLFGAGVYLVGFVLVGITAGYYLAREARGTPYISHGALPTRMTDPRLGLELFISRCSICHNLRDIMTPRPQHEWEEIVSRMVELAAPRIKPAEASLILQYLSTHNVPRAPATTEASPVDQYCTPCHDSREIMRHDYDRNTWENVVRRMSERAPDIVPPDKIKTIVDSLVRAGHAKGR